MTRTRPAVLWGLVAEHAAEADQRVSIADVCAVAAGATQVSGAWVTMASGRGPDFVMCVTGPVGEQLAELQQTLGEGPCNDALATAAPVLAADLEDGAFGRRWPGFTPAALELGAAAVFAFPLSIGAIQAGVMGLYRDSPGPLPTARLGDGLILADAATMLLLDRARHDGDGAAAADGRPVDGQSPDLAMHRAEIDQATGMVTVQLGVGITEAFARLRAYAYAHDRRLADVASDIVARRLRLHDDPGWDGGP
jgi:hypothetical protein